MQAQGEAPTIPSQRCLQGLGLASLPCGGKLEPTLPLNLKESP